MGFLSQELGVMIGDFFSEQLILTVYMIGPTTTNVVTQHTVIVDGVAQSRYKAVPQSSLHVPMRVLTQAIPKQVHRRVAR